MPYEGKQKCAWELPCKGNPINGSRYCVGHTRAAKRDGVTYSPIIEPAPTTPRDVLIEQV